MPEPGSPRLFVAGEAVALSGWLHGCRSRALRVPLAWAGPPPPIAALRAAEEALLAAVPGALASEPPAPEDPAEDAALHWVLHWTAQLLAAAGHPLPEPGRLLRGGGPGVPPLALLLPLWADGWAHTVQASAWVLAVFDAVAGGAPLAPWLAELPDLLARWRAGAPASSNTGRFARAAHGLGLQARHVAADVMHYGQGRRSCWLDSSFTEATSQIGCQLAETKQRAASVLRQAGIPVPAHVRVRDGEAAVRAARRYGFPVVVKPADRAGGRGVAAGLETEAEVRAAYDAASAQSDHILVERHVEGRDYRLTVFRGRTIWAVERVPGGVVGDGRHTVRELLAHLNADPARLPGPQARLRPLLLDAEAEALLGRVGLTPDAVPAAGTFVRLRRAANVACGGTPVPVTAQVHPDNARLAERAAAALLLDFAGVDLLLPDIARSWLETGAGVCEVNARPTLGVTTSIHLYPMLLRELVPGAGRIPIALVLGLPEDPVLPADVCARLGAAGLLAGRVDLTGVWVGSTRVAPGGRGPCGDGLVLLADRHVAAAVLVVADVEVLRQGLPCDRFDVLLVAGPLRGGDAAALATVYEAARPGCEGPVWQLAGAPLPGAEAVTAEGLAAAVADRLLAAEVGHAGSG